ncbi:hypothetical protein RQP46_001247 [Phenoliferia psychrophenolica]
MFANIPAAVDGVAVPRPPPEDDVDEEEEEDGQAQITTSSVALWLLVPSSTGPLKTIIERLSPNSSPASIPHIHLNYLSDTNLDLAATLDMVKSQLDAFKSEEVARRQGPTRPLYSGNGGSMLMSASLIPLAVANPYYAPEWNPAPLVLPFTGLASSVDGELVLELELTIEYRSLLGALSVKPPSDTRMWTHIFRLIRDPERFECGAPAIGLGPDDDAADTALEGLWEDGTIVDGEKGVFEVGGAKEIEVETLVVVQRGEEGWVEVARFSLF